MAKQFFLLGIQLSKAKDPPTNGKESSPTWSKRLIDLVKRLDIDPPLVTHFVELVIERRAGRFTEDLWIRYCELLQVYLANIGNLDPKIVKLLDFLRNSSPADPTFENKSEEVLQSVAEISPLGVSEVLSLERNQKIG